MQIKQQESWGFARLLRAKSPIYLFVVFFLVILGSVSFDAAITRNLTSWPAAERQLFELLARLGESDWMLVPTLLVWAVARAIMVLPVGYRRHWLLKSVSSISGYIFVAVAIPGTVAALLKVAIGRARPLFLDDLGVLHFTPFAGDWRFAGFPSGHATTAFALAFALYHLFGRPGLLAFVGAFLISLSRIVDGAHFFSDVLAGAVLGSLGAMLVHRFFVQRGWIFEKGATTYNRMLAPIVWATKRR